MFLVMQDVAYSLEGTPSCRNDLERETALHDRDEVARATNRRPLDDLIGLSFN